MTVAVFVSSYPELSQTFVLSEMRGMRRAGRAVRVEARGRAARPNPEVGDEFPAAFSLEDSLADRLRALVPLVLRHPLGCLGDLFARRRWRREEAVLPLRVLAPVAARLRREGVTHLHVHFATEIALDAMRLSRLLGLPYSVTAHAYEIYQQPRNLPEKLVRAAFSTSGCDYTVRDLRALVPAEHRERVHRIIMGVDPGEFVRRCSYPGGRAVVAVGRLVEKKGFRFLVDAMARLDGGASLAIIGEGPEREALSAQIDALGIGDRVSLVGALSPSEIRSRLEAADVLAMPCVVAADGDRDSMPVVVKEALAMEIPVVCSDEVGLPELVRDEWGRLVPPADPAALAAALDEILGMPVEERIAMGRAGREFVSRECDIEAEARKLLALIDAAR